MEAAQVLEAVVGAEDLCDTVVADESYRTAVPSAQVSSRARARALIYHIYKIHVRKTF